MPRDGYSGRAMTSAAPSPAAPADEDLLEKNRRFYDLLWSGATLVEPQRFNTWPLVQSLLAACPRRLEVAPGLRPRLPLAGTQFVDISAPALAKLHGRGAQVVQSQVSSLPFPAASFDLVCALDIVEHVDDDEGVLAELARVARAGATVLISTPCISPCGRRSMTSSATSAATSRANSSPSWRATTCRWSAAPCSACSRAPRAWSTPACGGSCTIASAPCGGTTACSCASRCGSRRSCASARDCCPPRASTRCSWCAAARRSPAQP